MINKIKRISDEYFGVVGGSSASNKLFFAKFNESEIISFNEYFVDYGDATDFLIMENENIIITSHDASISNIIRISKDGNLLESNRVNVSRVSTISKNNNSDFFIVGSKQYDHSFAKTRVIKLDSALQEIWMKEYTSTTYAYEDYISHYSESDNSLIFSGQEFSAEGSGFVIKIDEDGNTLAKTVLPYRAFSMMETNNHFYFTSYSTLFLKTNKMLETIIKTNFTSEYGSCFKYLDSENILLGVNDPEVYLPQKHKIVIINTDNNGNGIWRLEINENNSQLMLFDKSSDNKLLLLGKNALAQIFTIKTSLDVTQYSTNNNPDQYAFTLKQNYPNPFSNVTNISYIIPNESYVTLSIFNSLGEKVDTFINAYKDKGEHVESIILDNLASGIYYYVLKTEHHMTAKKMVIIN